MVLCKSKGTTKTLTRTSVHNIIFLSSYTYFNTFADSTLYSWTKTYTEHKGKFACYTTTIMHLITLLYRLRRCISNTKLSTEQVPNLENLMAAIY